MAKVTADQMKSSLLTLEQVHKTLEVTEPIETADLSNASKIKFKLEPDWAMSIDAVDGTAPVGAFVTINGKETQLTKDAALQAGAEFGLTAAYMKRAPAKLIEPHLNYWFSGGMGDKSFNMLSVAGNVAAFAKPTLTPFSNIQLLENAVKGIQGKYGKKVEILADYKLSNSIVQTDVRLIIPESTRHEIVDSGMSDVLDGNDSWSAGIHLTNSLTGKTMTTLEAYLFRWWCTNGCTEQLQNVGTWTRRQSGSEEDVYAWAQESVDEILGGMEDRFAQVQALTSLNVGANTPDVLRSIFEDYAVPVTQRNQITESMLGSNNLSMYSIMQAITRTANDPAVAPRRADALMRIGGAIPTKMFDTLKAQVWREGHTAEPEAANPYAITA